jgi:uncharacterized protein YciI
MVREYFLIELTPLGAIAPEQIEAQLAFVRRLTAEGKLLIAGAVPIGGGRGIGILIAASLQEAQAIYASAPLIASGKASVEIWPIRVTGGLVHSS